MIEINKIFETFEIESGVDIMKTPSAMTAICEYIIMNGIKSDWEAVYTALRCLRVGDKPVAFNIKGGPVENYAGAMYRYVFNLFKIWDRNSWIAEGDKYAESREFMLRLNRCANDFMDYLLANPPF